jgi:predicted RNase H-like HicB family nuclease
VLEQIRDAVAFRLEGLRAEGEGIPLPASSAEIVEIDA